MSHPRVYLDYIRDMLDSAQKALRCISWPAHRRALDVARRILACGRNFARCH